MCPAVLRGLGHGQYLDFMNQATNPRARGALFTTSSGGGFRLSANDGSGQPTLFNTSNEFSTFSPQRLFGVEGGSVFDITFRDPAKPTQVTRRQQTPLVARP